MVDYCKTRSLPARANFLIALTFVNARLELKILCYVRQTTNIAFLCILFFFNTINKSDIVKRFDFKFVNFHIIAAIQFFQVQLPNFKGQVTKGTGCQVWAGIICNGNTITDLLMKNFGDFDVYYLKITMGDSSCNVYCMRKLRRHVHFIG